MVAVVTAVGGGTVRDLILDTQVFWIDDPAWLVTASLTGVLAFAARSHLPRHGSTLAYLDAMGVALFGAGALIKCTALGVPMAHGVVMGLITAIGGGLIRDTLTSRETLLVSPELYATPIIVGLTLQAIAMSVFALSNQASLLLGASMVFIGRALAIYFRWSMPEFAINRPR